MATRKLKLCTWLTLYFFWMTLINNLECEILFNLAPTAIFNLTLTA